MKKFFINSVVRIIMHSLFLIFLIRTMFTSSSLGKLEYLFIWVMFIFNVVGLSFEIKELIQKRKSKKLPKKTPYLRVVDEHPVNERKDFLVYEMYKDADFKTLFGSLSSDLKSLAFESQKQIETFCKENRQWLRTDGYGTFFLFTEKVNDEEKLFVARVNFNSAELEVYVFRLSHDCVWPTSDAPRLVVPAAKKMETQS